MIRDRPTDQWNNREHTTDPIKYSQLIFDRGAREEKGGKTAFSTNGAGVNEHQ